MDDLELHEAMDACRAGHDDLSAPELAALTERLSADPSARRTFDRLRRLDERIRAAVSDMAAPAGLTERILKRVQENGAAPAIDSGAPPTTIELAPPSPAETVPAETAPAEAAPTEAAPAVARRFSRRTWWLAGLAASALVAASAVWFWPKHEPLTSAALVEKSGEWLSQVWKSNAWKSLPPGERGLASYPPSGAVRTRPSRWADVTEFVGERAIVYDVSFGNRRAALFVIPSDDPIADSVPPQRPQSSTLGQMIGCWQSQGMVYVLVVDGHEQDYRRLVAPVPQPPLT